MANASAHLLDTVRAALLELPRVAETMQWGSNLVFWTMDKAVGGKMFALIDLDAVERPVLAFAAGPQRASHLLEIDGIRPAPYLARAHWVACDSWQALPLSQLLLELRAAYEYVGSRMPARVQRVYELPTKEYRALVRESRAALPTGRKR
ncbi:MmcQ/YjbR family DNA-binding protein [Terriglobus aquaticus]|uniref:MmcQ/YjbR family DNA-binding protein n=1 Tax=Terriglobus aquaticus TaxID=940139 RepID=A0ABW9KN34_9BACT|nr:MmcQ/YjbR family DNA-binding protein [Terriglobus aquaticus]